jgi:hypothetical protein
VAGFLKVSTITIFFSFIFSALLLSSKHTLRTLPHFSYVLSLHSSLTHSLFFLCVLFYFIVGSARCQSTCDTANVQCRSAKCNLPHQYIPC